MNGSSAGYMLEDVQKTGEKWRRAKCFEVREATCSESTERKRLLRGRNGSRDGQKNQGNKSILQEFTSIDMEMFCEGSTLLIIHFWGEMDKMLTCCMKSTFSFLFQQCHHVECWRTQNTQGTCPRQVRKAQSSPETTEEKQVEQQYSPSCPEKLICFPTCSHPPKLMTMSTTVLLVMKSLIWPQFWPQTPIKYQWALRAPLLHCYITTLGTSLAHKR